MDWQPIETAPEGQDVIVATPDRLSDEWHIHTAWRSGDRWSRSNIASLPSTVQPTYWMPLPDPPRLIECDGCSEVRADVRLIHSTMGDTAQCKDCAP